MKRNTGKNKTHQAKMKKMKDTRSEVSSVLTRDFPSVFSRDFWKKNKYPALILFLLSFLLYAPCLTFDYVLDDKIVLSENTFTRRGIDGIWDILTTDCFQGYLGEKKDLVAGGRYRPLSMVTYAVEYQFFGLNPGVSHFFNILLYALTVLMLYGTLFLLLPQVFPQLADKPWFLQLPFITSLLFALHPLHSEVVANIKGRDEILALLLSLAVLYFSLKAMTSMTSMTSSSTAMTGGTKNKWLAASAGTFFLALLAKENAITFLVVIPLALFLFYQSDRKKIFSVMVPLAATAAVYVGIRYKIMGYLLSSGHKITSLMNNPFVGTTLSEKYATILHTLGLYIKLLLFPHPLTHDYYPYQIPIIGWADPRAWGSLLLYLLIAGYALYNFKKKRIIAFSFLYYLITLSIVSNLFFPIGTFMNERFMFIPSVGFCLFSGYFIAQTLPDLLRKTLLIPSPSLAPSPRLAHGLSLAVLGIIIMGYSIKTITRVPAWKNTMSLNRAAASVSTKSARANCFMGVALYQEANAAKGNRSRQLELYREAGYYIDRALSIYPAYPDALKMKAGVLGGYFQHDHDLDKLLKGFYEILKIQHTPFVDEYMIYLNKRVKDVDRLTAFYHRTGFLLFAQRQKNYPLAIRYLDYGIQLDPENIQILLDLTRVCYLRKDYRKAWQMANRGLKIDPNHVELRKYVELTKEALSGQVQY